MDLSKLIVPSLMAITLSISSPLSAGVVRLDDDAKDHQHDHDDDDDEMRFEDLPKAVQKAFDRDFPKGKVEECEREREDGETFYEIEFRGGDGREREVTYTPEGRQVKIEDEDD